jgi:hypothetical protein
VANNISYFWQAPEITRSYTTAVALHGHTIHSKESLYFISDYANRSAVSRRILAHLEGKCEKVRPNFGQAYWTPPLPPRAAYELEKNQIENTVGLASMVSLTDHDNVEAALLLRLLPETRDIAISFEWTVPYESTEIHLGVHNLPGGSVAALVSEMQAYTADPNTRRLPEILAGLNDIPELLLVLNHPLWDLCAIGRSAHRDSVERFLMKHNSFFHAFELGGLRNWQENQDVVDLAEKWKHPAISGGDRHGCEPAAVLNLTRAVTFGQFVEEVRRGRLSNLVFMPQYRQSWAVRMLRTVNDVVADIPGHPLGARWDDRTFHPDADGVVRPLSQIWQKCPGFLNTIFAGFRLIETEPVKAATRFVSNRCKSAFRLPPLGGEAA